MRDRPSDNIGVTFVNLLLGRGIFNGVVNLTFGVFNFTPDTESKEVPLDPTIAARLRMDLPCARYLYKSLGELLAGIDKSLSETPPPAAPTNEGVASGKPH